MTRSLALAAFVAALPAAAADDMYFVDIFWPEFENGAIRLSDTGGAEPKTIVDTGFGLRSIQVFEGKIYWCDAHLGVIRRANLDGSGQEDLVTDLAFPAVLRIDQDNRTMYWGDQVSNDIRRANLDGSDPVKVVSTAFHRGLAIDDRNDKIYWSTSIDMFRGEIKRCDFDGSDIETVVTSQLQQFKPASIALDTARGRIYWTDYVVDVVQSAPIDGGNIETIYAVGANWNPEGIALDRQAGKIYWGQQLSFESHFGDIRRMDLDGAHVETVLDGVGLVNDIVLVPAGPDGCYGDYNGDGTLDLFDFLAFVNAFNAGEARADCTGDGMHDLFDFLCFVNAFNQGC